MIWGHILAVLWEEPLFLGVVTPLITASVLYIVKKVSEMVRGLGEIQAGQVYFRDAIHEIMENQTDTTNKVDILGKDLRDHMKGEESTVFDILGEIRSIHCILDKKSLEMARTAFRQAGVHSDIPFYDTAIVNGEWEFQWGNRAYFEIAGISLAEAKAEVYWDVNVREDYRDRFKKTLEEQAYRGDVIDVDYVHVTPGKGSKCVNLVAIPVTDLDGNPMAYFGAIKTLGPEEACDD